VFEQLASTEEGRSRLVNAVVEVVEAYDLDGVDMDWEFPEPGGSDTHYALLMEALHKELSARDKTLTAAVLAGAAPDGSSNPWTERMGMGIRDEVLDYVEWINVMAYDGGDGFMHAPYSMAQGAIDYWKERVKHPSQIVLGVPFYGRPDWQPYQELVTLDPKAPYKDVIGDIYYNGQKTMIDKTNLALRHGGGVMIWEVSQDTTDETSLLRTIHQTVHSGVE
jgi:chitinase